TNIVVQRTNTYTFPGWQLMPVAGQQTWFQTYPQYILGKAEATVTILDGDTTSTLPSVSIFALDDTAVETGNDSATIVVTRTGSSEDDMTVNYYIGPGPNNSATSDDYIPVSAQVIT